MVTILKFIRLSESLIEKNGEGILGFITNHGYLDNPTFRGMRWHLMRTFDKIYVLDLHGNAKKKEVTPEGQPDKNVFDIQQGVAIIIAIKKRSKRQKLAEIYHGDLWGTRDAKQNALTGGKIGELITKRIDYIPPQYAFVPRNHELTKIYGKGFELTEFMPENVTGIVTMGDGFALANNADQLRKNLDDLIENEHTEESLKAKYGLGKNYAKWILSNRKNLAQEKLEPIIIAYRPFDKKVTYFDNRILWRWRKKVMQHMINQNNFALAVSKQNKGAIGFKHVFCHHGIAESSIVSNKTSEITYTFPLYLYPTDEDLDQTRRVNFDPDLYAKLQTLATHPDHGTPDELAVFDYIYGVLHCPVYRKTYAEFLKIDFPRIPWPTSPDAFWDIVAKGRQLRQLHLMEPTAVGSTPYPFTGDGDHVVDKPRFADGHVWINARQYFANAPEVAWGFYIGGYQPAQKWLKDRKGRALSFDDVKHYQRILKVLAETDRIMHD